MNTGSTSCDHSGYCGGHVLMRLDVDVGLNETLDQLAVGHSGYCGGHVLMRLDVDVGLE